MDDASHVRQRICAWIEPRQQALAARFTAAGRDAGRHPAYAALSPRNLGRVVANDVLGLVSWLSGDGAGLEEAGRTQRELAEAVTAGIPAAEQLAFLEARLAIVREMARADETTEPFRAELERLLDAATRVFEIHTPALEHELDACA